METKDNIQPSVAALQEQVNNLCNQNGIRIYKTPTLFNAASDSEGKRVRIPEVRSTASYAVCLHEIGHNVLNHTNKVLEEVVSNEIAAWNWAKQNALVWTDEMEDLKINALTTHEMGVKERLAEQKTEAIMKEFVGQLKKVWDESKGKISPAEAAKKIDLTKLDNMAKEAMESLGLETQLN